MPSPSVSPLAPATPLSPSAPLSAAPIKVLPGQVIHLPQPSASPVAASVVHTNYAQSPLAAHHPWVTHTFAGLFLFSAITLIVLLAVQTTKQEGLSGTLGGRVESAYRPRLGFDQQLERLTTFFAISFVILGLIVSLSGI